MVLVKGNSIGIRKRSINTKMILSINGVPKRAITLLCRINNVSALVKIQQANVILTTDEKEKIILFPHYSISLIAILVLFGEGVPAIHLFPAIIGRDLRCLPEKQLQNGKHL